MTCSSVAKEVKSYKLFGGESMCSIARRLLAEKLIDDFYEQSGGIRQEEQTDLSLSTQHLTEQLQSLLPDDQQELLFQWEAQCNEICSLELRRFAAFVAEILVTLEDQAIQPADGQLGSE